MYITVIQWSQLMSVCGHWSQFTSWQGFGIGIHLLFQLCSCMWFGPFLVKKKKVQLFPLLMTRSFHLFSPNIDLINLCYICKWHSWFPHDDTWWLWQSPDITTTTTTNHEVHIYSFKYHVLTSNRPSVLICYNFDLFWSMVANLMAFLSTSAVGHCEITYKHRK